MNFTKMSIVFSFAACTCIGVSAGLPTPVVSWKMDSLNASGQVPDATGGSNHLRVGEGCSLTNDPRFGTALFFNGTTNAWGQALNATQFTGTRSVSLWLCRMENDGPMDPAVNKIPYVFQNVSGTLVNYGWNNLTYRLGPSGASSFDVLAGTRLQWMHMVVVVEKDEGDAEYPWKLHAYKDGGDGVYNNTAPKYGGNAISANTGSQNIIVGNNSAGGAGTRPFYGMIADMRVYDKVLTAADAKALYMENMTNRAPCLVGQWTMDALGEADSGGNRIVVPAGPVYTNLTAGSGILLVSNAVSGSSAFFTNVNTSAMWLYAPFASYGISFGAYMNFATNLMSLENEANNNKIPHVYSMGSFGRMCLEGAYRGTGSDNRAHVFDVRSLDDSGDQGFVCPRVTIQKGRWGHLGVTYEMKYDEPSGLYGVQPRIYVDGELVSTGRFQTASTLNGVYAVGRNFTLGNNGSNSARTFGGLMDDFCFFMGVLSDEQMKELAAGLPSVSAGEDFTVVGQKASLCGRIGTTGALGSRKAAAVTPQWSVVSAPVGGEEAAFNQPADVNATVTLPIEGEYVLRLTIKDSLGRIATDEVTVTRTSGTAGNAAPTVSVSGSAAAGTYSPVAFSATVADPDNGPGSLRVSWKVVSGPDAVRFEPAQGVSTKATFFGEGTYRIAAVATDGDAETVSAPFEVTVSSSGGIDLENGLIGHWPFEYAGTNLATGVAYSNSIDYSSVTWEQGVDGYAIRVRGALYPYFDSNSTLLETEDANLTTTPVERYRAFSCWLYHDTSDTNNSSHATIVDVPYTLGLWYNCEDTHGFSMYQQTLQTWNSGSGNVDVYGSPAVDPANRWTHVYALFDRRTNYLNSTSELWIDGVKQTNRTKRGMGGGRVRESGTTITIEIGGHANTGQNGSNGHFKDGDGNWLSRTFPGIIDEVRMYNRALTEAEIKYLADNPVVTATRPPAVSGEPDVLNPVARKQTAVEVKVNTDVYPAATPLSYAWCILSGDASKLVFADPTARATTVTAMKPGVYVVQLAVSDGARTVYSAPIPLDVQQAGITISFK